jgi:hypothetical protein
VDDAGTHELVHHIRGKATPEEEALGSFTCRKLKPLPIWDVWLASEWLQLDSHQKQKVFGAPCPAPPGATVLRSQWNYIIKPCGTRNARMYCDGSKRAAPELRFAQTYASCIDQPCMRLFSALSAAMVSHLEFRKPVTLFGVSTQITSPVSFPLSALLVADADVAVPGSKMQTLDSCFHIPCFSSSYCSRTFRPSRLFTDSCDI